MTPDLARAFQTIQDDRLIQIVLPIFFGAIVVEALWAYWTDRDVYERRDFVASMWMLVGSILIEIVPKTLLVAMLFELHEWSPLRDVVGRQPWAWAALFVLDDLPQRRL